MLFTSVSQVSTYDLQKASEDVSVQYWFKGNIKTFLWKNLIKTDTRSLPCPLWKLFLVFSSIQRRGSAGNVECFIVDYTSNWLHISFNIPFRAVIALRLMYASFFLSGGEKRTRMCQRLNPILAILQSQMSSVLQNHTYFQWTPWQGAVSPARQIVAVQATPYNGSSLHFPQLHNRTERHNSAWANYGSELHPNIQINYPAHFGLILSLSLLSCIELPNIKNLHGGWKESINNIFNEK